MDHSLHIYSLIIRVVANFGNFARIPRFSSSLSWRNPEFPTYSLSRGIVQVISGKPLDFG